MNNSDHGSSKMFENTSSLGIITVSILKEYPWVLSEATQPLKCGTVFHDLRR